MRQCSAHLNSNIICFTELRLHLGDLIAFQLGTPLIIFLRKKRAGDKA